MKPKPLRAWIATSADDGTIGGVTAGETAHSGGDMAEIKKFYPKHAAKNPDVVLERAIGEYKSVLILGIDKEDCLCARKNTDLSDEEVTWLVQRFIHKLHNGDYSE